MAPANSISFNNNEYTRKALFDLGGKALVALHNEAAAKAGASQTKRFSTIDVGVTRTWDLLQKAGVKVEPAAKALPSNGPGASLGSPTKAEGKKPSSKPKAEKAPKAASTEKAPAARRGTNLAAPGFAPIACREGSKQAKLLDLLCKSNGVTMPELIAGLSGGNTPWKEATVRSGFGWDMKQKGYGVRSEIDDKGVERFFIVLPKGHPTVPAHRPLKTAAPKAHADQTRLPV